MARKLPRKDAVIIGLGWTGSILAHELTVATGASPPSSAAGHESGALCRAAVETIDAAIEMPFDEPLNVDAAAPLVASMIASQSSRAQGGTK